MKETDYQPRGNELGRITAITETRYQDDQAYRSRQQFSNQLSGDQLVQTISFTDHDGLIISAQPVQQVNNGQLLQETDV
ncbi:hypothetical protein [Arsenophonus endosymbiont of Aleurodicus floccissimus]|uniref:hypothetical protein n=1 Tax=Arsenophonus endosymbiont of Aleurodicus floccissimus TaxID=2152761 RepID=UPI000E6B0FA0|nr:hypothetical protein [Arsenophonus endosymbiont of Aleurodicus floccissimus]